MKLPALALMIALPAFACGGLATGDRSDTAPGDASLTTDSGTDAADASPPDAGAVTSLEGAFHAGIGGENNLTIDAAGSWSFSTWVCGSDGAGGGRGAGVWSKDGDGLKLLPAGAAPELGWVFGSVSSVSVTIVGGRLHTVSSSTRGSDAIDFHPGYECYVACGESTAIVPCSKPR
jgi:hypothetical protein